MDPSEITIDALEVKLLEQSILIDVREPEEYAENRVPGAQLVPLGNIPEQAETFSNDQPIYLICASGARSQAATIFLRELGLNAINVLGGTEAWKKSGRECHSDQ